MIIQLKLSLIRLNSISLSWTISFDFYEKLFNKEFFLFSLTISCEWIFLFAKKYSLNFLLAWIFISFIKKKIHSLKLFFFYIAPLEDYLYLLRVFHYYLFILYQNLFFLFYLPIPFCCFLIYLSFLIIPIILEINKKFLKYYINY